ncbi:TPA: DUF998 domain-containing protein [Stenotrophomonas maltophilia]|nr:DUF998 domain-containing protein [Stenotrophomonas maltophilia]
MSVVRLDRWVGVLAAALFVLSVAGFGAALPDYSQALHPVTWLGAHGIPHALGFNLLGLVLPGALAVVVAERLRRQLPVDAAWTARVGSQMLLLAALAFIAMGLLPLDFEDQMDMQGPASKLHASVWMVWALAFVAGSVLLGAARLRHPGGRRLGLLALGCGTCAGLLAFGLPGVLPAALAQRLAFACWALWLALALPLSRRR